jgi:hypothetical protein
MQDDTASSVEGGDETVVSPAHAEVVDASSDDADAWSGPHTEYNQYGLPTGHEYVRCRDCGVVVLAARQTNATHRTGCTYE